MNSHGQDSAFATTRWSMVLAAGKRESPAGEDALQSLCRIYWYPLYAYARRRGSSAEDASDLTQEFFVRLLEKEFLETADPGRGRFRSFLLTVFKRFMANEYVRGRALKRGGGRVQWSIDAAEGERRYGIEPTDDWTAERLYERRWGLTLLDSVLDELQREYERKGKSPLYQACLPHLVAAPEAPPYAEIADQLRMSVGAVRVAVHRMREHYREILTAAVCDTVGESSDVDDELAYLQAAIRGESADRG